MAKQYSSMQEFNDALASGKVVPGDYVNDITTGQRHTVGAGGGVSVSNMDPYAGGANPTMLTPKDAGKPLTGDYDIGTKSPTGTGGVGGTGGPPTGPQMGPTVPQFGVAAPLENLSTVNPYRAYTAMRAATLPGYDPSMGTMQSYQSALGRGYQPMMGRYLLGTPFVGGETPGTGSFAEFMANPANQSPADNAALRQRFATIAAGIADPLSMGMSGQFSQYFDPTQLEGGQIAGNLINAAIAAQGGPSVFNRALNQSLLNRYKLMQQMDPTADATQSAINFANYLNQQLTPGAAQLQMGGTSQMGGPSQISPLPAPPIPNMAEQTLTGGHGSGMFGTGGSAGGNGSPTIPVGEEGLTTIGPQTGKYTGPLTSSAPVNNDFGPGGPAGGMIGAANNFAPSMGIAGEGTYLANQVPVPNYPSYEYV